MGEQHVRNIDMEYTVIDFVKVVFESTSDPEPEPESLNSYLNEDIAFNVFPNPVVGNVSIRYNLEVPSSVNIELYNMNGKRLMILHEGSESAGTHDIRQSLDHLNAGEYILRVQIETRGNAETGVRKITVL